MTQRHVLLSGFLLLVLAIAGVSSAQVLPTCGTFQVNFRTDKSTQDGRPIFIGTGTQVNFVPVVLQNGLPAGPNTFEIVSATWYFPDAPGEEIGGPDTITPESRDFLEPQNPSSFGSNGLVHTYDVPGVYDVAVRLRIIDHTAGDVEGFCPNQQVTEVPFRFFSVINVQDTQNQANARFNIVDAVQDRAALVPNNDWVPLAQFTLTFAPNQPAPSVLYELIFILESDNNTLRPSDIQQFAIFSDRGGDGGAPDGVFDALNFPIGANVAANPNIDPPLPIRTFDAKGYPDDVSADKEDLVYDLILATDPTADDLITAGPDPGRGYFLAMRTSSAWSATDDVGIFVPFAQIRPIGPPPGGGPVEIGLPRPSDSYSPDFLTGATLDPNTRYITSSLGVVDFRSPAPNFERYNQQNWPIYQYTPVAEFNRLRFNATGLFLQSVLGEQLDIRDMLSYENWQMLLGMDLAGQAAGPFLPQPSEVNLVLTDIGADPYGPPGNGGLDPRNGRLDNFSSAVTRLEDGNGAVGDDHMFNGVNLFWDKNNDGLFQPPTVSTDSFGASVSGSDSPMYLVPEDINDNSFDPGGTFLVTSGLLEWEYVPFPPGGGDPWWKVKMAYDFGARPSLPERDNTDGIMEISPDGDEYIPGSPRLDYFITIRPDSGYRDVSGKPADGTAAAFGFDTRAFIEPRRWNPEDGGHWDGGMRLSQQYLGFERAINSLGNLVLVRIPFWQDDTRYDAVCAEGLYPCPTAGTRTFDWFTSRTQNQSTAKPVKLGLDVHDLVLTYSTNNAYAKFTIFRELLGGDIYNYFQDPRVIFAPTLEAPAPGGYGNGLSQPLDLFGIQQLNFFEWDQPFVIGDVFFGPDDLFTTVHYAFETVPFRLDENAVNSNLREPRSVYFPNPPQQPTLPSLENWPPTQRAVAFGFQSYCFLASEGDIANEPFLPASSDQSEASYEDDVYVFVAEDCNNCGTVQPGMWLVDRYGAKYQITAVNGRAFTLRQGHNAYLDRNFRFRNGRLSVSNYPFGVQVGENNAVRRGTWMVVEEAIQRGQLARQQDWPEGLESEGGARAARILKQKVEASSQPTAMLGINLTGVNDPIVNASEGISLNSVTVAFWGPEFDRSDLAQLDVNGALAGSGVLLYEDSNQNGVFDGPILNPLTGTAIVNGDSIVPLEAGSLQWRGTGAEPIDLDGDFQADDLSGDGILVLTQAEREAQANNPDYDGLIDTAWVLSLEPAAKWIVPYTEPSTGTAILNAAKSAITWPSFWTESPSLAELASVALNTDEKALNPTNANGGDDLFVVVRTSATISAFEQFRALIPAKLPTRSPASEQVAGVEMAPITYPVVQAFQKLDPEEGAVQSYFGHDMLEVSVPSRVIDLTSTLVPSPAIPFPVIEPGSAPVAVLGIDSSANRPENLIATGNSGSQISNGYTTASFTKNPTSFYYDNGWTQEVIGLYLIAMSDNGSSGLEGRLEAYEIVGAANNDLTLRAGQPRVGSAWYVVKDPTFLEQVVVEFEDVQRDGDFNPQRDLLPLNREDPANGLFSGISIYRDNDLSPQNRNGVFDPPVRDANGNITAYVDLPVRLDDAPTFIGVPGEPEYQVRLVFSTPGTDDFRGRTNTAYEAQPRNRQWIPQTFGLGSADPNTGADFFVVLRTSRDMNEGDDFRVGIVSWGPNTPSLPDPDNFTPSVNSGQLPGQRPDEFDIFDEFPWGSAALGYITFFQDAPPIYYWGYDHVNRKERAVQEVDHSQDDKDVRYWIRSHPAVTGATNVITSLPAPEIDFTSDRHRQVPGGAIAFTLITDSTVSSVLWNFGDGQTSTQRNPTHTYDNPGVYTVSVTVTNAFGVSDTVTKDDYIEIIPAPFADFTATPLEGSITPDPDGVDPPGLDVTFIDASRSTNDLVAVRYFWDFGDGTTLTTTTPATAANPVVHRYTQEGFYTVTLEVTFRNPVTQNTVVSICQLEGLITVKPCIGCPGSGEGETEAEDGGDGEGDDTDPPAADLEITTLIRDKESLVPLQDWMPLANIVMSYGEDDFAPRILRTLNFTLRPDTRDGDAFGIANINGPQQSDILEFGIFQETFDSSEDDNKNNLLDSEHDFLLYTFSNTGAPIGASNDGISSVNYSLNFVGNGTAADPQFRLESGPDGDETLGGNSYILAVRTSATWRSQTTMGIDVNNAQMIDPRNGRFPVNDEGDPIDSYSPNFQDGETLSEDLAYSASFSVWDVTGNQFDDVQIGGAGDSVASPFNFWNHPSFLYTPLQEHTRPLWNTPNRLFEITAGEVLELRQLISAEQWVPVLGINLHAGQSVHTSFNDRDGIFEDHAQLKEVNLVFTDIGADPLGPPGNGGFNPREMLDKNTDDSWTIFEPAFASDETYNGAWIWHDTNGNGRFDPGEPDPDLNGTNFPGDRPMYSNFGTLSAWEYNPFPPGGGDPWWKITLRTFGGERRPDDDDPNNFDGFLTAVPDNIAGNNNPGASEITFDYFVTVRADSGFQDVSLAPGDLNGIAAGADFRVFVEPRRFDGASGSETGGIYVDSMTPAEGIVTNGASIYSTWQDDPRWLEEEPWWPERTHNAKSVKPLRAGLEVHDLALTYESDSDYAKETELFFGGGPFWDGGCLTYAVPTGGRTDFDAWNDPFGLQQSKFLNGHSVGVLRFRFFGARTFDFGDVIGEFNIAFDETRHSGQFAYETAPFFSNSLVNGDVPPAGPRSTAYPTPPNQPSLPDYSNWPAFQRPNEYQRASDWNPQDRQARLLIQQVESNSVSVPVLGINMAGANDQVVNGVNGPTVGKITVAIWGPEFQPSDLAPLDARGSTPTSGVALWEDGDRDGVFTDSEIFRQFAEGLPSVFSFDNLVTLQNLRWPSAPELIDLNGDGTPDDMDGNGAVDDRDRAWVLDLTPANLWNVPRLDDPVLGFGTLFELIFCGAGGFKSNDVAVPYRPKAQHDMTHVVAAAEEKQLDPTITQPGDDLFVTIRTSESVKRFEKIRAVIPASLPTRAEGQRQAGIQFFPQFNTSATAFIKSNPDEDPVQDFYGHDTLQVGVPARLVDLTNQNSGLVIGGAAVAPFGIDLSTNQGRTSGTLDTGASGVPDDRTFQVPGRAWAANGFARDFLIDRNFESFEILSNTGDTLQLRSGTPADGVWRIVRDPSFLETVILEFYNEGQDAQFNISADLLPLKLDQELSGVALYRDNDNDPRNRNGIFDVNVDIPIKLDVAPRLVGNTGEATQVQFVFSTPGTDDVPQPRAQQTRHRQWIYDSFGSVTSDAEFGPDFFVVVRASDRMAVGDNFRIGIVGYGPITPTEPDPDTFASIQSESRNDATKFREFPWAKRALGFISYTKSPLVEYYMDSWRAGQKPDNSGFDWIRSHSNRTKRTGVLTAQARTVSPRSVVIEGATQTALPAQTLPNAPFTLVINGRGFGTRPDVAISGYNVNVVSATDTAISISVTVAEGVPTEPIVLIVRNPDTGEEASRSDLFTVVSGGGSESPNVTSVTPDSAGSEDFPVTVLGTNLPPAEFAFVAFGQTRMPVLSAAAGGTSLSVGFPAGGLPDVGPLNVTVRDTRSGREDILLNGFTYNNDIPASKGGLFSCAPEKESAGGFWGDLAIVAGVAMALLAASRWRRRAQ